MNSDTFDQYIGHPAFVAGDRGKLPSGYRGLGLPALHVIVALESGKADRRDIAEGLPFSGWRVGKALDRLQEAGLVGRTSGDGFRLADGWEDALRRYTFRG